MTTAEKLADKCGHGLVAWKIDGYHFHERAVQVSAESARLQSRGLLVDACERPPGVSVAKGRTKR